MERMLGVEELLNEAGWLRRLAAGLVGEGAQAEDLLQDTWVAALRRPPSTERDVRPWLARVVRNLARNAGRDRARREARESFAHEERESPEPAALAQEAEAQRLLAEAVTRLAEPLRAVIVLRYFQGLDSNAAAEHLGVPASTVRTRTQKALEELRAPLDRRVEGGRRAWAALLAPLARRGSALPAAGAASSWPLLALGAAAACGLAAFGVRRWSAPVLPTPGASAALVASGSAESEPTMQARASFSAGERQALPASAPAAMERETPASLAQRPTAELSGTILVDGRAPEWPLLLTLESATATAPDGSTLRTRSRPLQLTLQPEQRGEFAFRELAPEFHGRLVVSEYVLADGEPALTIVAPTRGLVLRLQSGPEIVGRIVSADGSALVGLEGGYRLRAGSAGEAASVERTRPFLCRADGGFRFASETSGEWAELTLRVESGLHGFLQHTPPHFVPAKGLDLGELVLEPTRTLAFTVRDPHGAPIAEAFAYVDGPQWAKRRPLTGADGSGELALVPQRPIDVRFAAFGFAERELRVEPGSVPEVVLEPLSVLTVSLRGALPARAERLVLSAERSAFRWDESDWNDEALLQLELGRATPPRRRTPSTTEPRFAYEFGLAGAGVLELAGVTPGLVLTLEALDADGRVLAVGTVAVGGEPRTRLELGAGGAGETPPIQELRHRQAAPQRKAP